MKASSVSTNVALQPFPWSVRVSQTTGKVLVRVVTRKIPWRPIPCWLLVFLASAVLLSALAGRARAGEFGGCFAAGKLCAGPSATITVGEFNLSTSKFSGGVSPGIGYGITYAPTAWYATGLAGYLSFSVGGSAPNSARPALLLSFANYLRLGVGMSITEADVGTARSFSVLFGVGTDVGGSPAYVQRAGGTP